MGTYEVCEGENSQIKTTIWKDKVSVWRRGTTPKTEDGTIQIECIEAQSCFLVDGKSNTFLLLISFKTMFLDT